MNLLDDMNDEGWKTKCCIYCYTNLLNNKKYIGQVNRKKYNLLQRHRQHISSSKHEYSKDYDSPFHRAIRKYGITNFKLIILSFADIYSVDILEKYYIELYDTINNGYNISDGGSNGNNFAGKTEEEINEIKKRISEKAKERLKNKENHPMYGKHFSEESKQKIKNTWNNKTKEEKCEIKRKISNNHADTSGKNNGMYSKHHTDESKKKMSDAKKGKKLSKEIRQKMSDVRSGKPKGELVAQINKETYEIVNVLYNFEYEKYGFTTAHISSCCKNKLKQHKGFIFKYLKDCDVDIIKEYIIKNKQMKITEDED